MERRGERTYARRRGFLALAALALALLPGPRDGLGQSGAGSAAAAPESAPAPAVAPPALAPPAAGAGALSAAPAASPIAVDVSVAVEPDTVKLGDALRYRATFRAPRGTNVYFPDDPLVEPFRREGKPLVTRRQEGDRDVVAVEMTLRPYRLGLKKVPRIEVPALGTQGEAVTLTLPEQRVRVLSRLTTEADPALAPPPESAPVVATNWFLVWGAVALGALAVGALFAVLVMAWLRRREAKLAPPPPPRPAHEIALGKLARIEREDLPAQARVMEFYVRVSEATREYFGNRYGFDGLAMSSRELLDALHGRDLHAVPEARVRTFLEESDLVKFASFAPAPKEVEWLLHTAYALVRDTMVVEEAAPPDAAPPDAAPSDAAPPDAAGGPGGERSVTETLDGRRPERQAP